MADVPQRLRAPEKQTSLAEMAARAAQKSRSTRPPPVSPFQPGGQELPPSIQGFHSPPEPLGHASPSAGGSGLIHLQRLQGAPSAAPQVVDVQQAVGAPSASASAPEAPRPSRSKGLFVGAIVALLGVGAAYGIAARKGLSPLNGARSALSLLRGEAPSSPAPQLAAKEASPPNVEHAVAALPPAAAPPKGVDPASLPHPNTITPNEPTDILAESKAHAKSIPASKPAEKAPSPVERAAPVAAASAPKAEPAAPEPTGLAGAIKKAVGPTDQAAIPTETQAPSAAIRGDIPEVPAQGAIQGAIGSQRGAARSCVAGHDSPSRATLVFGSSGKVQSVSVTGPAAGSAAESCIRSALTKASVGAFRRPTFSVSTTISPP